MKTLKFKEDEVLDDFVNRATNAAELQQEIKNQIKHYLYRWFGWFGCGSGYDCFLYHLPCRFATGCGFVA